MANLIKLLCSLLFFLIYKHNVTHHYMLSQLRQHKTHVLSRKNNSTKGPRFKPKPVEKFNYQGSSMAGWIVRQGVVMCCVKVKTALHLIRDRLWITKYCRCDDKPSKQKHIKILTQWILLALHEHQTFIRKEG